MTRTKYERGTPHEPLSVKWRVIIVSLLLIASSGVATAILYTQHATHAVTVWSTLLAAAGALTCLVPFLYDATMYGLAIQLVAFVAVVFSELRNGENPSLSLSLGTRFSTPIIAVAIPALFVPFIYGDLAKVLNPLVLSFVSAMAVLYYSIAYVFTWKTGEVTLFATLTMVVGLAVLIIVGAWFRNRTHRHMNLMSRSESGTAVSVALAWIFSIQRLHFSPTNPSLHALVPMLLGSTICTLICVTLAATGDVWNAVGSNQFWMLALDMTALSTYSIVPAALLIWRLWLRCGTQMFDMFHYIAQSLPVEAPVVDETQSLLTFLSVVTFLGLFFTKSLCPLGGHLLGRVYTSGMHFSKAVALCMDWSHGKHHLSEYQRLKVSCSFVVTCDQLNADTALLKAVVMAGHIVIPYVGERAAHEKYEEIWGKPPEWAHGESYPPDVMECTKRGTKIALWSSYIREGAPKEELAADLEATLGGNLICMECIPNVVEIIEGITSAGFKVVPLSIVMKEHKMELPDDQNAQGSD